MYKIALIQNDSEMLRYSWADTRPFLNRFDYKTFLYTGENIRELFRNLQEFDALFVSTNACNDRKIYSELKDNKVKIEDFLSNGKGLLITQQMKLSEIDGLKIDFVPDSYTLSCINRVRQKGENVSDGDFVVRQDCKNHVLLRYPKKIIIEKTKNWCLRNDLVEGLYWLYMVPCKAESFLPVLVDPSYGDERYLMLVSRPEAGSRIVITSLALDWQMHYDLLENTLKFVVEGMPFIAVVSKKGETKFDFNYFISNMKLRKIAFANYELDKLDFNKIQPDLHSTIVLDPSWTKKEILGSNLGEMHQNLGSATNIIWFESGEFKDPMVISVGGLRDFDMILRNALSWLYFNYEKGSWGGSFWITMDVMDTLVFFDQPIEQYKREILSFINTKRNKNGSLDNVFGATCGLLRIYDLLLDRSNQSFQETLKWIRDKFESRELYERATGIDTLIQLKLDLSNEAKTTFISEVMQKLPSVQDELTLYRYAKTLVSCGAYDKCHQFIVKLKKLQDDEGKWRNIPTTANIVLMLLRLRNNLGGSTEIIDEMIYRGVVYLKESYSTENLWKNDLAATATALRALGAFERTISFPLHAVMSSVEGSKDTSEKFFALNLASTQNLRLQDEKQAMMKEMDSLKIQLQNEEKAHNRVGRLTVRIASLLLLLIESVVMYVGFLLSNMLPATFFGLLFGSLVSIPPLIIAEILRRHGLLARSKYLQEIINLLRRERPKQDKE